MDSPKNLNSESFPEIVTLVDLLRYRSAQPSKVAFTFLQDGETESCCLTYQELDRQAQAIAVQLRSLVAPGSRALLVYPPGLEFIAAFFGCLYAGVVAVPAYPPRRNQNLSRLQAIAADARATVALTTTSALVNIEPRLGQTPELLSVKWVATDNANTDWVSVGVRPDAHSNTIAFLQYTSGSTGVPKGVMVSHGNLLHNSQAIKVAYQHTEKTIFVGWLPLFHDMGLIGNVLQPLYLGIPCFLMSPIAFLQKPSRWLQLISRYKATTSGGPNFAYDLCVSKITPAERERLDLSSWDVAFNGAEPVRAETLERFAATFAESGFRREAFYPCYGMAEATLFVTGGLKTATPVVKSFEGVAHDGNKVVPTTDTQNNKAIVGCGQTRSEEEVVIVDPESLIECPGKVGEIWVSGSSVAQGYWNQPSETEKTFKAYTADTPRGPFLRTGDLGFLWEGDLFVTGRIKDSIVVRGQNHYPQDIELTVEKSHPALRKASGAAFAVEVDGVEQVALATEVERSYLRQLDVDEVVGAIRQAVSEQHELQVYAVVLLKTASIPKTSSGKIQRHACKRGFLEKSLDVVGEWTANIKPEDLEEIQASLETLLSDGNELQAHSGARNSAITVEAIETWLVTHLALYMKLPPDEIDIGEPFARYGLDSSVAVSMTAELSQWLGSELEPTLFWEFPSIEALAEHLQAECQLTKSPSQVTV